MLRCLFYECSRVDSVAPFLALEAREEVTLGGERFPKGTAFNPLMGYVGRNALACEHGIPGAQPERFDPLRWRGVDGTVITPKADSAFLAFGHGLRRCPGKELALFEAVVTVATLLRAFHFAPAPGHPPVGSITKFAQMPDRDILLVLTPR